MTDDTMATIADRRRQWQRLPADARISQRNNDFLFLKEQES